MRKERSYVLLCHMLSSSPSFIPFRLDPLIADKTLILHHISSDSHSLPWLFLSPARQVMLQPDYRAVAWQ